MYSPLLPPGKKVFSFKCAGFPPPHLEKDKKKKKPRHFQTKKPFTDKCHFPVLICACLFFFPFFTKRSQCGRLTEKCVCANGLWGGGRCCGGGGRQLLQLILFFAFQKACISGRGKKGHTVK